MIKTLLVFSLLALTACSSKSIKNEGRETFTTHISADDEKLFTYTLNFIQTKHPEKKKRRDKEKKAGEYPGGNPGIELGRKKRGSREKLVENEAKLKEKLQNKLTAKLNETGFCREGYIAKDEYVIRGSASLRGQCVDFASDEDKINFPNTVKPKAKVIEEELG